ncbi:MAG: hypothetical protein LBQ12_15390 [Deltaproteobacteria bacterium]|nr:hypothetical protein [Deltaproteobacteria bacterium]
MKRHPPKLSTKEFLLPVLKAAAELTGRANASGKTLKDSALRFLAERRKKDGSPAPDSGDPSLVQRVRSADYRLKAAGLLKRAHESPMDRVTEEGRKTLAGNPERLDFGSLWQHPQYREAMARSEALTNLLRFEREIKEAAVADMAEFVRRLGREGFRRLAGEITRAAGGAGRETPPSGMPSIAIDAAEGPAALASLKAFAAIMDSKGDDGWALFTRGDFSGEAAALLVRLSPRIKVVGTVAVAELMYDLGIGVEELPVGQLKNVTQGFFKTLGS